MANKYTATAKRQGPPEGYTGRWPMNFGHALQMHWQDYSPEPERQRTAGEIVADMSRLETFQEELLDVEHNLEDELIEAHKREESAREEAPVGFTASQWAAVLEAIAREHV